MSMPTIIHTFLLLFGSSYVASFVINMRMTEQSNPNFKHSDCKDFSYFASCSAAGAVSCSFTHSLLVPIDVVKTRMQTGIKPGSLNAVAVFKNILHNEGPHCLFKGLGATFSGYFIQGACKFGLYEYFKYSLARLLPSQNNEDAMFWRLPILLLSAATAELIASFLLCPLEVTRVYMITNTAAAQGQSLLTAIWSIASTGGPRRLFSGLPLILLRQVPYTCAKLVGYELFYELASSLHERWQPMPESPKAIPNDSQMKCTDPVPTAASPAPAHVVDLEDDVLSGMGLNKNDVDVAAAAAAAPSLVPGSTRTMTTYVSNSTHYVLPLICGVLAGMLAALVSQPADFLFSQSCHRFQETVTGAGAAAGHSYPHLPSPPSNLLSFMRVVGSTGLVQCYVGIGPRMLMIGILTSLQFVIYEALHNKFTERRRR